jgi:mRNA-degrading endonuclease RelE of RelBE toxin-antitoxin system
VEFLIADTFTDSLAKLTGDEQKSVKTTGFDLQLDPTGSGMSFHRLDRAKDKNFWSVRASRDIRLVVHARQEVCCCATSIITMPPTSGRSDAGW